MRGWIQEVVVIRDVGYWNKTFDKQIYQLHRKTVFPNRDDDRFEGIAQAAFEQNHFLPVEQFAFGLIGKTLALAGLRGDGFELCMAGRLLVSARHRGFKHAM